MKLFTLLPLSLLSLAATLPADTAPGMTHWDKRSNVWCDVTGKTKGANVHCRAGPSTDSKHVRYVKVGDLLRFTCYKSGECIDGNCTWDYTVGDIYGDEPKNCYISGRYTDKYCTAAALGKC